MWECGIPHKQFVPFPDPTALHLDIDHRNNEHSLVQVKTKVGLYQCLVNFNVIKGMLMTTYLTQMTTYKAMQISVLLVEDKGGQ